MQTQQGVTIIETLLVLVIASTLILIGIRQYQSYRFDVDIAQLKYNVDTLFNGMLSYFRANCGGTGTLSPFKKPPTPLHEPYLINIQTDLIAPGFLGPKELQFSPLVLQRTPDELTSSYDVQFRPTKVIRKSIQPCPPSTTGANCPTGYALMWTPEIMVYLNVNEEDADKAALIGTIMNAPCVDPANHNKQVACGANAILLFTHQVSFANTKQSGSSYWIMNPILDQFRDANTTYNTVLPGLEEDRYYYCGG